MARQGAKLFLGLALLGALALCASAQVDSVENLVPTFDDTGRRVNRNAPVVTQTNPGIAIETDVKNTTAAFGAPAYAAYFGAGFRPGVYLTNRTNCPAGKVQYRVKIFNTGSVTLKSITVTLRDVLTNAVVKSWTIAELRSGRNTTFYFQVPFALNQQGVNGIASTSYNGKPVTANNRAHYFGVRPRIWLAKSVQNATQQWEAANTEATAVTITEGPVFLFQIKNTGNFNLTNIRIVDSKLGSGTITAILGPSITLTFNVTGSRFEAGLNNNSAQVRGTFVNPSFPTRSETAFASDFAWTNGKQGGPVKANLTFNKSILDAETDEYVDANTEGEAVKVAADTPPNYQLTVRNTGNVDLTDVTFYDPALGDLSAQTIPFLAVGATDSIQVDGNPSSEVGTFIVNEAYATAMYGTTPVTSNKDKAVYEVVPATPVDVGDDAGNAGVP